MNRSSLPNCLCCSPAISLLSQRFLLLGTEALAASVATSGQGKALVTQTTQNQTLLQPHSISQHGFADAIYVGEVVTVNDAQSTAEAVAIKDGKIVRSRTFDDFGSGTCRPAGGPRSADYYSRTQDRRDNRDKLKLSLGDS